MKWNTKPDEPHAIWGDKREIKIFAILPHKCEDGTTRWLESLIRHERVMKCYAFCMEVSAWQTDHYESIGD